MGVGLTEKKGRKMSVSIAGLRVEVQTHLFPNNKDFWSGKYTHNHYKGPLLPRHKVCRRSMVPGAKFRRNSKKRFELCLGKKTSTGVSEMTQIKDAPNILSGSHEKWGNYCSHWHHKVGQRHWLSRGIFRSVSLQFNILYPRSVPK